MTTQFKNETRFVTGRDNQQVAVMAYQIIGTTLVCFEAFEPMDWSKYTHSTINSDIPPHENGKWWGSVRSRRNVCGPTYESRCEQIRANKAEAWEYVRTAFPEYTNAIKAFCDRIRADEWDQMSLDDLCDVKDACPNCKNRHQDSLVWLNDEADSIQCASCGHVYRLDDEVEPSKFDQMASLLGAIKH